MGKLQCINYNVQITMYRLQWSTYYPQEYVDPDDTHFDTRIWVYAVGALCFVECEVKTHYCNGGMMLLNLSSYLKCLCKFLCISIFDQCLIIYRSPEKVFSPGFDTNRYGHHDGGVMGRGG